ncbi:MAG: KpsF/GutQ family sugar-phosphate isomerase [Candidatus Obscuribacterales bacterium]|nr:KpsF/GutQ family sugar-phosphate isomerase [Candidatus Obscuribacterales bacterium]
MNEFLQNLTNFEAPAANTYKSAATQNMLCEARRVLEMESEAILGLTRKLGDSFVAAIQLLTKCGGKVVVTGMGKSGHIGNKIAATLASTGTPAFFVHPAELRHGDFGMLDRKDVVLALSATGETQEIKLVLDPIKRLGLPIISFTGNPESTLARFSDVVIDVGVEREACPLNLAPTSSTTATLAMGDALAVALMVQKGFRAEDFARSHPGGSLGKQLVTVEDLMRSGFDVPAVDSLEIYDRVLAEIDRKRLGFTTVLKPDNTLAGIITDGDVRRALVRWGSRAFTLKAHEFMTLNPKTISASSLAVEALKIMETHSISDLLILDRDGRPSGVIHLKDLLRAGVV